MISILSLLARDSFGFSGLNPTSFLCIIRDISGLQGFCSTQFS